jgi:hypothetical protein
MNFIYQFNYIIIGFTCRRRFPATTPEKQLEVLGMEKLLNLMWLLVKKAMKQLMLLGQKVNQ